MRFHISSDNPKDIDKRKILIKSKLHTFLLLVTIPPAGFHPVGVISLVRLVSSRQSDPTISRKAMHQPIYPLNLQVWSYIRLPILHTLQIWSIVTIILPKKYYNKRYPYPFLKRATSTILDKKNTIGDGGSTAL